MNTPNQLINDFHYGIRKPQSLIKLTILVLTTSFDDEFFSFVFIIRKHEDFLSFYLKMNLKIHDNLSDLYHQCFFSTDLKHVYLTIPLYPNDRHYFAFTISGKGQIQFTRMQQKSKFASFIFIKLVYRVFGTSPPPLHEPSLFH